MHFATHVYDWKYANMQMRFRNKAILDCEADLIQAFFSHDGLVIEYHIAKGLFLDAS